MYDGGGAWKLWSKREAVFHRRRPTFYRLIWFTYCLKIANDVFPGLEMQSPQCWTVTLVALWRPKCFLRVTGLDELKFLQIEWRGLCAVPAGTGVGGAWVGESLQVGGDSSLPRAWSSVIWSSVLPWTSGVTACPPSFHLSFLGTRYCLSLLASFFLPRFSLTFWSNALWNSVRRTSGLLP